MESPLYRSQLQNYKQYQEERTKCHNLILEIISDVIKQAESEDENGPRIYFKSDWEGHTMTNAYMEEIHSRLRAKFPDSSVRFRSYDPPVLCVDWSYPIPPGKSMPLFTPGPNEPPMNSVLNNSELRYNLR